MPGREVLFQQVGRHGIGWLSDRLGHRKPVMLAFASLHLLCWLPLLAGAQLPHVPMLALFFLIGLGAASFTLSWACAKEVNPHALSGMAMSIANTGSFLGAGILQPLVGWSVDATGAYSLGLWILSGFAGIGFIGALLVRETYCRYATSEIQI